MVMQSAGPDGITVPGGAWTNQSTLYNSNKTLESYGAASSSIINPAVRQGYSAWSFDPILAVGTAPSMSGVTWSVLVYVTSSFTTANIDWIQVAGTPNVTCGLWPATAPAGTATPLAYTTAAAATAAAVNTQAWNTAVSLTGGNFYFVTVYGSTTGTIASATSESAAAANAGYYAGTAYSITTTYRSGNVGTLNGTLTGSSVFGTSVLEVNTPWVGLH